MAIDPYQVYAGIDIQANGYNTPIRWDLFESGENSTHTSLGIYCPSCLLYTSIEDKEASEDDTAAAEAFLEYIKSDDAMKVFEKYGFTAYKADDACLLYTSQYLLLRKLRKQQMSWVILFWFVLPKYLVVRA